MILKFLLFFHFYFLDNKKLSQDFGSREKQAKEKINQMKKGKFTENKVYEWILENK